VKNEKSLSRPGVQSCLLLGLLLAAGCGGGRSDGDGESAEPVPEPVADAEVDLNETPADARPEDARTDDATVDVPADDDADQVETRPFTFYSLNHVLSTGQSLSVGSAGSPPLSTTQPYHNKMFNTGVLAGSDNLTHFLPLVEAGVETMSSGMANLVTSQAREEVFPDLPPPQDSHDVLVSCHGVGGTAYAGLKKGTAPFASGMAQVEAAASICDFLGLTYVVRAVTSVHGESDHVGGNTHYAQDLVEWQADYENDVMALTGQLEPVPMLHTQMSSWTKYGQSTSLIPGAQLQASIENPGKIVLVGPKYFLAYAADGVHLSNAGYLHMGEVYAKVYDHVILRGETWEPLWPILATIDGTVITVTFHVPVPPLVFDTTLVTDPGDYGFEFWDDGASVPAISSVEIDGTDRVVVTLASPPSGTTPRIRYAWTGTAGALAGPTSGPRGNLRDSDETESLAGNSLYNWAVHFDIEASVPE